MIVDSSALVAILRDAPDAPTYAEALSCATSPRLSAANWLETAVVIDAVRDPVVSRRFDELVETARIVVEAVTARQAEIVRAAYRDFGKGSGHPAQLNFGDCFAYALAKDSDDRLLFKGDDFGSTDIRSALDDAS